ncbi:hypothetical protein ACFPZL_00545 [Leucobacter soli]|uniref:Uncharacterized protein n=1 Tax=Leucobacter soli TaxID=2812850 RepID=A0A916NIA5_9MICO|nr:hypothetical protein [Leucobacter soli]CAG7619880.1 hypothetical protein LEUCIP111803_02327 [Leucobacter soli]
MSESQQAESDEVVLSRQTGVPVMVRIGGRNIETTFMGNNAFGQPTWVLWNPEEPYLLAVLRQGQIGYTFEQRTSHGVMLHEDVSFKRVQRALISGGAE